MRVQIVLVFYIYIYIYSDAVKHTYDKQSRYGSYTYTHAYWILAN